jgi:hypothetical protein
MAEINTREKKETTIPKNVRLTSTMIKRLLKYCKATGVKENATIESALNEYLTARNY